MLYEVITLAKGSGADHEAEGDNELGLHGNALLSRYPIRGVRSVALENGKDKMSGREKRLGRQAAVAAEIDFPNLTLTAASVHLDANSTQAHRRDRITSYNVCYTKLLRNSACSRLSVTMIASAFTIPLTFPGAPSAG